MREWVADHVRIVAAVVSLVALGLVLAATADLVPADAIPAAPAWVFDAIPHVNAVIAVLALAAMGRGFLAIRRRDITRHRRSMAVALVAFGTFLALYLYNVAVTGAHPFPGPDVIYYYVYLPILIVHMGLAIICIPLLIYVALLATTRPVAAIPQTPHATIGRPALLLWAISFVLGLVVYLQLHVIY